ncbi:MAG: hypothetical protein WDN04_13895 [Rhodospirillales bacterium]
MPQGVLDLLNKKQEAAVLWLWVTSERPWYSAPTALHRPQQRWEFWSASGSRRSVAGDGFAAFYSMTSFGRSVRAELDKRLAEKAAMQKILDEMAGS